MTKIAHAGWKERLKDSSWVTLAWDWFMTLLGRVVEAALWTTMVFSCYQLIPGAPQPASVVSNSMFILQFVALDIGGIGLGKLAQAQGMGTWSYMRFIASILIGLTLVTVAYAGLEHVVTTIPAQVTSGIEVSLVVARSVMTVLYGQAIHGLKQQGRDTEATITVLEAEVSSLSEQVSSGQQHVSTWRPKSARCPVWLSTWTPNSRKWTACKSAWRAPRRRCPVCVVHWTVNLSSKRRPVDTPSACLLSRVGCPLDR